MYEFLERINRWITGESPVAHVVVAVARAADVSIPTALTSEQVRDRALMALDLQIELVTREVREGRQTPIGAAHVLYDTLRPEIKSYVSYEQLLDGINAELLVPLSARDPKPGVTPT